MRDVTNSNQSPKKKIDIKALVEYLVEYVKNPIQKISQLPDWNWPSILTVQILLSIASGLLAGLIKLNFYRVAAGIFLMPIVSTTAALLLSLFIYYYFQFFENRTVIYRKIFMLVILASIPFYLFQILSEYISFISVVGFAFTSLLAVVGLCENFQVERKRAYLLVGMLFALVLVTWITNQSTSGGYYG